MATTSKTRSKARPSGKTAAKAKPAKAKPAKAKSWKATPAKVRPAKAKPAKPRAPRRKRPDGPVLRAIRSVIYTVNDLALAKQFYSTALGREPYFDQSFYVGFDVDGQELGLDPDTSSRRPGPGGAVALWRVDEIQDTFYKLVELGGQPIELPHGVGEGIQVAIVGDPFGNLLGLIQTP
ncbi:MAG: VOC family protein [Kofleriaceae bacterium]